MIGGTGGSGTRVVARIVAGAGRFMGTRLNGYEDALDLARFDWRWGLAYVRGRRSPAMAAEHDEAIRRHLAPLDERDRPWGWKHPHSYLLLPFLAGRHPGLRFVHVVRDGRDMAFSANQRQALRYGDAAGAAGEGPVRSASFWAWANLLADETGAHLGDGRYLVVRFEDLCRRPESTVRRLLQFGGALADDRSVERLAAAVSPPQSLGRWRSRDERLVDAVTEAARPALVHFGYLSP